MDLDDYSYSSDYSYDYGSSSTPDFSGVGSALAAFGALGVGLSILIGLVSLALIIFQFYVLARIIGKMGFSPWLVLLNLIPIAGIVMMIYFAFVQWPIEKELVQLKGGQK